MPLNINATRIITSLIASTTITAFANEWSTIQYGSDSLTVYEVSLIEESGIFSKDFIIWLKATHAIDESSCGTAPPYNTGAISSESIKYGMCRQNLLKEPKEEVFKVSFNCKNKNIVAIPSSSTNFAGNYTPPTLQIGTHPGSLGCTSLKHYCK